jgi:fructosamine-3-kinase
LKEHIIQTISSKIGKEIVSYSSVRGGDINHALLLKTEDQQYFCKYNTGSDHAGIIMSEIDGLNLLKANGVLVPDIIAHLSQDDYSAIIMEWIKTIPIHTSKSGQITLADQIIKMHSVTSANNKYGADQNNYIGRLVQTNIWYDDLYDYYYKLRLLSQFSLAYNNGYFNSYTPIENIAKKLSDIIPNEAPSLIHGDLWSGNYIISHDSKAYLIDPSVSYGHREMDIAMLHLFGSVPELVMDRYTEIKPLTSGWQTRMDIFQLYYLLVHLNMFGRSYLSQVESIIEKYK